MITSRALHLAVAFLISATLMAALITPSVALGQEASPQNTLQPNSSCSIWDGTWGFNCGIWFPFTSAIGSTFLSIGAGILVLAGSLFDQLLKFFVVDFQGTLVSLNMMGGIEIAWQLFRDITNVVIIGVFVFVAIMTILGSTEYGTKRLISRVLIVAVLINFSFLFTRVIIESTNFVSAQFARSMPNNALEVGVAQSFLQAFGIEGVFTGTSALTDRVTRETDSGWAALLYGFVGSIFLMGIAGVLLYGVVIISARALLLIFMLITAPLAFASFLIPKWSNQAYIGWNSWWSNLLKAAMFGPILMVFLWIAMQIVSRGSVSGAGTAIGKLANNPASMDVTAWQQLIFLMIGTGILFVGIRASSSFASSIGGFDWAGMGPAMAFGLAGRVTGVLGRNSIGYGSYLAANRLQAAAQNAQANNDPVSARRLDAAAQRLNNFATRDFNAMNNRFGKEIQGVAKLKSLDTMIGKSVGGYLGAEKKKVERIAQQADRLKMSDDQIKQQYGNAIAEAIKTNKDGVGDRHAAASEAVSTGEKGIQQLVKQQEEMIGEFNKGMKSMTNNLEQVQLRASQGDTNATTEAERIKTEIETQRSEHQASMNQQGNRIRLAKNETDQSRLHLGSVEKDLEKAAKEMGKLPEKFQKSSDIAVSQINSTYSSSLQKMMGLGEMVAKREESTIKIIKDAGEEKRIKSLFTSEMTQKQTESSKAASVPTTTDNHA